VLRLLNESLGGQGGWLLGFAVVAGIGLVVLTRLRRDDARTGWIVAVGGAFLTTAVAFSQASGIFHPYYVSQLAPFTAALVGAGVGVVLRGGLPARVIGPLAIGAGIVTELIVLGENPGQLEWVPALLIVVGGMAAVALALGPALVRRAQIAALVAGVAVLLLAPGTWAFQTLGHATSGTFPAGGPASAGFGGPGGGRGFAGGGGPGGGPPGFAPPGATSGGQAGGPGAGMAPPTGGLAGGGFAPGGSTQSGGGSAQGGFGGNPFGGNSQSLTEALAYARQNGGGTLAVSSQSGAASQLIRSGSDVAAIGGFSGRESQVSVDWLADAVEDGRIRWVLTDGSSAMPQDGRVGSTEVMAAAAEVGTPTSVDGLYDLSGHADDLRALAG
jgi:hypothetical protein